MSNQAPARKENRLVYLWVRLALIRRDKLGVDLVELGDKNSWEIELYTMRFCRVVGTPPPFFQ